MPDSVSGQAGEPSGCADEPNTTTADLPGLSQDGYGGVFGGLSVVGEPVAGITSPPGRAGVMGYQQVPGGRPRGAGGERVRPVTVAVIEPASRTIPATITQRRSLRAVPAPGAAVSLGHGDPVAAAGSDGAPGERGRRAPARLRRACSRIVLTIGRDRVIGARVRVLAAGRTRSGAPSGRRCG